LLTELATNTYTTSQKEINAFEKQLKSLLLKLVVLVVTSYIVLVLRKKLGIKIGGEEVVGQKE